MANYKDYTERSQNLNWKPTKYCVQKQEEPIPPLPSFWSEYVKVFKCNNNGTTSYGNETHKIHIDYLIGVVNQLENSQLSPSELTPSLLSKYISNIKIIRTSDSSVNVLPYQQEQHTIKVYINYPNATKFLIYKDVEGNCYGIYLKYIQLIKKSEVDNYSYTKIPKEAYTNCLDCLQPWEEAQAPCWGDHHFFFGPPDLSNIFAPSFNIDDNSSTNQEELVWFTMSLDDGKYVVVNYSQVEHPLIANGYLIKNIMIWKSDSPRVLSYTATENGLVKGYGQSVGDMTVAETLNSYNEAIPYYESINFNGIIDINIAYHINSSEDTCSAGNIEYLDLEIKPVNYGFYNRRIEKIGGLFYYLLKEASEQSLGTLNNTSSAGFDGINDFLSENRSNFTIGTESGYRDDVFYVASYFGVAEPNEDKDDTIMANIQETYNYLSNNTGTVDVNWDPLSSTCRYCYSYVLNKTEDIINYNTKGLYSGKICVTDLELSRIRKDVNMAIVDKGVSCFSLLNDCHDIDFSGSTIIPDDELPYDIYVTPSFLPLYYYDSGSSLCISGEGNSILAGGARNDYWDGSTGPADYSAIWVLDSSLNLTSERDWLSNIRDCHITPSYIYFCDISGGIYQYDMDWNVQGDFAVALTPFYHIFKQGDNIYLSGGEVTSISPNASFFKIDSDLNFIDSYNTDNTARSSYNDGSYTYLTGNRDNNWDGTDGNYASVWKLNSSLNVVDYYDSGSIITEIFKSGNFLYLVGNRANDWSGSGGAYANVLKLDTDLNVIDHLDLGSLNMYACFAYNNYIYVGGERSNTWPGSGGEYASLWKLDANLNIENYYDTGVTINDIYVDSWACYIAMDWSNAWTGSGGNYATVLKLTP